MALSRVVKLLKPAKIKEELQDRQLVEKKYRYWRIRIFYSMYIGYVFFYFTRKSFTFIMPKLVDDLGFSYGQLGFVSTVLYFSYAVSKFVSGVLSDRSNPRFLMSIGLIMTGIFNILFGLSSSIWLFVIFWGLNGWFQGWGWAPITKQLTHWYGAEERGMWWSICSTSHNVGGALIPLVVAYYAEILDWQYSMFIPGVMCILVGLLLINRLRDVPQSLGLPPIEKYKGSVVGGDTKNGSSLTIKEILFDNILNKFVLIMSANYFFIYIVRTAVNDWTVPYLVKVKGYDLLAAGASIFWFEGGGFLGMLFAGWATDRLFNGRRVPLMMICAVMTAFLLFVFWALPSQDNLIMDFVLMSLIGFCIFVPQMLIGLAAAEYVDKKAACSANGFAGFWGYIGAAAAGFFGFIIDTSWDLYFITLIGCNFIAFVSLMPILEDRKSKLVMQN